MKISAIVHTCNSEETVERALRSLAWVDELLVVDMDSSDGTLELCRTYATRIYHQQKVNRVDGIRNRYLELAAGPWIFVLDSDEFLAADAPQAVRRLINDYGCDFDAFRIPRYNLIGDQIMRGSGWYPDPQIRLFRKGAVRWSDSTHRVPEVLTGESRLMVLEPPDCLHIHHRNYRDLRHFIAKQLAYALQDNYDANPDRFSFSDYMARAYTALAARRDTDNDGDLSHALSLVMAWDAVIRGLIHWDSLDPQPPLEQLTPIPIRTESGH